MGDKAGLHIVQDGSTYSTIEESAVHVIERLANGDYLVGDDEGLKRFRLGQNGLVTVTGASTGYVSARLRTHCGSQNVMVAAMQIAEKKACAHRS